MKNPADHRPRDLWGSGMDEQTHLKQSPLDLAFVMNCSDSKLHNTYADLTPECYNASAMRPQLPDPTLGCIAVNCLKCPQATLCTFDLYSPSFHLPSHSRRRPVQWRHWLLTRHSSHAELGLSVLMSHFFETCSTPHQSSSGAAIKRLVHASDPAAGSDPFISAELRVSTPDGCSSIDLSVARRIPSPITAVQPHVQGPTRAPVRL